MDSSTRASLKTSRDLLRYIISYTAIFAALVVFLSFLIPLTAAFCPSLFNAGFSSEKLGEKVELSRLLTVTVFTLKIAVGSTAVAFAIGFPAAFFCAKRNFLFKKFLLGLSAVPLCIPVLIASLGFVSVFGLSGILNKIISSFGFEKIKLLYSVTGIIIAQGFYNFPLVMSITARFWENLPSESENAARLLGAGEGRIFFKITLPALVPSLASSVIPVFLFCYFSFMMVLLFSVPGTTTLEVEIFQAVKTSLNYNLASRLAVIETLTALLIVGGYSFVLGKEKNSGQAFENRKLPKPAMAEYETAGLKVLEILLFVSVVILIVLFFVFPLLGIVVSSFTARVSGKDVFSFSQYKTLFNSKGFWVSLFTTLKVSFCTASVCTITGTVYALSLQNKVSGQFHKLLNILALLPMAVSSVVLGFGITLLFRKGNVFSLVLVQSALFWPLAYRQINSALYKIPLEVKNAALVLSGNYIESVFRVFVPWIKKSLFASFGFCFAFSAGDTTLPLILSIPKFQTLSLYTYRLSGSYRFNTACASGTVLALVCFFVFIISEKIGDIK